MTPQRRTPSVAQFTVSNDGRQYSGWPLVFTKGSGTFLKFLFDNSKPGCFDCVNSEFVGGLNPLGIVENWAADNKTGPYIGGTDVTISAKGLDWAKAGVVKPYDLSIPGFGLKYNGPVGGAYFPTPNHRLHVCPYETDTLFFKIRPWRAAPVQRRPGFDRQRPARHRNLLPAFALAVPVAVLF